MNRSEICILDPDLIREDTSRAKYIRNLCDSLWKEVGWHYWLDFIWLLQKIDYLKLPVGSTIVDAGSGNGALQFLLADRGFNVISVDFSKRRFPVLASAAFPISTIRSDSQKHDTDYLRHLGRVGAISKKIRRLPLKLFHNHFSVRGYARLISERLTRKRKPGKIIMYQSDMCNMHAIDSHSVDLVVSVSAIEHMEMKMVADAVREFARVLKPGAAFLVTTSAAIERDWFHEPSKGWCYTDKTIRDLFGISQDTKSNYHEYENIMEKTRNSQDMICRLSSLYFVSGENGMPWGKWDPRYLPVGILKTL